MIRFITNSLLTLGFLCVLVLFFAFNPLVEWRIQSAMQNTLNQTITFESVRLSPFTGSGDIGGVTIKGIENFKEEQLLYIPRVSVHFSPLSLWTNTLKIQNITIHDAKIDFAGTVSHNNVTRMIQHLSQTPSQEESALGDLRPLYNKRYKLKQTEQTGTTVAVEPSILKGHSISANVPQSVQPSPFGDQDVTLNQVVSYLILDVLSRSPEAITGEFNLLKEGLVGLGLLHKDTLNQEDKKTSFLERVRMKLSNLF
jgi:hypothetical protein